VVGDDESVQVVGDDLCLIWVSAMSFLSTLNYGLANNMIFNILLAFFVGL
jgi:hypothetical protein